MNRHLDRPALDQLDPSEEWKPFRPSWDQPWTSKWAAHLLRRAGFGPTASELKHSLALGPQATLVHLLAPATDSKKQAKEQLPKDVSDLRAEWISRLLGGTEPLREKMTLFWHNHFATSIAKVEKVPLMRQQNQLIRTHALGKFGPFLSAMSQDPAMLIWLDSKQNVRAHPNENFAREVMELFSLGTGNYTEKDVQEAARAFTGWSIDRLDQFEFQRSEHDYGTKTFLGQSGRWDGNAVLRILLEQAACPRFLAKKLYRYFVNENANPPAGFLAPLEEMIRSSDYDISSTIKLILGSRHFFSDYAYRQNIKSPVEYVIGLARVAGSASKGRVPVSPYALLIPLEQMGQNLFAPPNVKGWEGGKAWLNSATLLARHNFAHDLANGMKESNQIALSQTKQSFLPAPDVLGSLHREVLSLPAAEVARVYERAVDHLGEQLLPDDFPRESRLKLLAFLKEDEPEGVELDERCRTVHYALSILPEYQLN